MITKDGYSKDPGIQAEGIVVTWSMDLINSKGGMLSFIRYFEKCMKDEDGLWLQKCKNAPKQDIIYVYIIVAGRLHYRCLYGGHQCGTAKISNGDGYSWSNSTVIAWPRVLLAGPFVKAPFKRNLKGFQGFRYCTRLW